MRLCHLKLIAMKSEITIKCTKNPEGRLSLVSYLP